jgi:catechol 2,3-dioxygenase-like lactoylglutathione lyase family enzyme
MNSAASAAYRVPAISMIMLGVSNLERSLSFYRDQLGMNVRQQVPGFAFLDGGAITLVLSEALVRNSAHTVGATEVIFTVKDVRGGYEALRKQQVEFVHEPHNVAGPMWAANFRDPDGHLLTLFGPENASG